MDVAAIIIAGLSFLVALASLAFSIVSQTKASQLAKENTQLAHGMLEIEVRATIGDETARVNEVAMRMNPLVAKKNAGAISPAEQGELDALQNNWRASVQGMLNAYDEACTKYLDGKIDKERFKRNYHFEIRNLLESSGLKQFFDPHTSRYKAIIKLYDQWENLEK